jgi:enoyl-CoA hydratase
MESLESLRIEREGAIARVVLTGPGKGNAMGPAFWRELPRVFDALAKDDTVRAIVLRGDGKHFSYGLDLMGMMGELSEFIGGPVLAKVRTKLLDTIRTLQDVGNAVERCPKPVVAAIHGYCIGGGLDLVSACDVRLCSGEAKFSLREVKLAIVADIGSLQRLPYLIGEGATRELAFTGKDIDAARALRIGLVSEVFETPDALFSAADAMATEIAGNAPLTVQGIKRVMNYSRGRPVGDGLDYVALWNSAFLQSADLGEALASFMERRAPSFKGE